jgi:hypothetical protein
MPPVSLSSRIFGFIQNTVTIYSRLIAPYSSSATDTAAGLASEGFMNTYGKCTQIVIVDERL